MTTENGQKPRTSRLKIGAVIVIAVIIVVLLMSATSEFLYVHHKRDWELCSGNMKKISAAIQQAQQAGATNVVSVADLAPGFLAKEPHCPCAPKQSYTIDGTNCVHCPVKENDKQWPHRLE